MARPKHIDPETFTTGELGQAIGIGRRNVQLLIERGLAPEPTDHGGANANLFGVTAVLFFAIAGALNRAGLRLGHSGEIARALRWEFSDWELGKIAGLEWRKELGGVAPDMPPNGDFGFWLHRACMMTDAPGYERGRAWTADQIVLIADRRYVLHGIHDANDFQRRTFPSAVAEIIDSSEEQINALVDSGKAVPELAQMDEVFRDALYNAETVVVVNISLAVRNCLDAIHLQRVSRGSKLYDGGKANG
jgi:hypothetical protein